MSSINKLLLALLAVAVAGCATIISDDSYPVSVNSSPAGASFSITNRAGIEVQHGVTPQVVALEAGSGYFKSETYTIVVSKDGYDDKTFTVNSSLDGWYWGNILLGGLIGMLIVDPITGAMYKLPDRVDVSLDSNAISRNESGSDVEIVFATVDDLTANQRARLERVN